MREYQCLERGALGSFCAVVTDECPGAGTGNLKEYVVVKTLLSMKKMMSFSVILLSIDFKCSKNNQGKQKRK